MLEQIRGPADLQHLSHLQLRDLAHEIRDFLTTIWLRPADTWAPTSGVVELTLALHRVFDSPHDPIIFDTGHQAFREHVERQIIAAGYRCVMAGNGYLRWVNTPPNEGERVPVPVYRGIGSPPFQPFTP